MARPTATVPEHPGALTTAWNALTAALGVVMGLIPHVLHHLGLLAGAALVSGPAGNLAFALVGLLLSIPMLRRLYRRSGTWRAPPSPWCCSLRCSPCQQSSSGPPSAAVPQPIRPPPQWPLSGSSTRGPHQPPLRFTPADRRFKEAPQDGSGGGPGPHVLEECAGPATARPGGHSRRGSLPGSRALRRRPYSSAS
jgi:hypothetical protein